jgi:ABC-type transport system involved in multi-copper enzyme maturation permease subunit
MAEFMMTSLQNFLQNPVAVKELRSRMRGRRAFVVLTIYLLLMSGLISLVYLAQVANASSVYSSAGRDAGRAVFFTILAVQAFLVTFMAPAFTAAAISGEKERQTYDLLRTTLLSAHQLTLGKMLSALSYLFLLIFSAVPLQSMAFILGGVSLTELILTQAIIVVAGVTFAMVGLFFSSLMRSVLASTVTTLAAVLFMTIGAPIIIAILLPIFGVMFTASGPTPQLEWIMIHGLQLLGFTNFPATLIVTEIFLLTEDAIFYFTSPGSGGYTHHFISPWLPFSLLYGLLTLILYALTVWRIRRVADR